mmetsp:Transcript_2831/g.8549  ORF Transcript_2831/g.8549 Transcript_2831/m.8549 type:complete len:274 (-) Transcript_2831:65-886(-)
MTSRSSTSAPRCATPRPPSAWAWTPCPSMASRPPDTQARLTSASSCCSPRRRARSKSRCWPPAGSARASSSPRPSRLAQPASTWAPGSWPPRRRASTTTSRRRWWTATRTPPRSSCALCATPSACTRTRPSRTSWRSSPSTPASSTRSSTSSLARSTSASSRRPATSTRACGAQALSWASSTTSPLSRSSSSASSATRRRSSRSASLACSSSSKLRAGKDRRDHVRRTLGLPALGGERRLPRKAGITTPAALARPAGRPARLSLAVGARARGH